MRVYHFSGQLERLGGLFRFMGESDPLLKRKVRNWIRRKIGKYTGRWHCPCRVYLHISDAGAICRHSRIYFYE